MVARSIYALFISKMGFGGTDDCCSHQRCQRGTGPRVGLKREQSALTKIRPTNASVKAGVSVWMDVTLENKSDHVLSIYRALSGDMDRGGWVYKVDVTDAKGEALPLTAYAEKLGGMGSGFGKWSRPRETITDRVDVSKLYDLTGPGKYTIQFRRFEPSPLAESQGVATTYCYCASPGVEIPSFAESAKGWAARPTIL
jgi:hypothetical protein